MWEAVQDNWPSLSKTDVMEKKKKKKQGWNQFQIKRDQKHQMQHMTLNESSFEK